MYVSPDFTSKAALKRAVAAGQRVTVFAPGLGQINPDGVNSVEGPHYPQPHRFCCTVECKDGVVIKVK